MLQRDTDGLDLRHDNPFVPSTSSFGVQTVLKPPPQAYRPLASRHSPSPTSRHYLLLQDDKHSTGDLSPSKVGSLSHHISSSGRRGSRSSPSQSAEIYQEKSRSRGSRSPRSPPRSIQDPEKACQDGRSMRSSPSSNQVSHHSTVIYEEDEEDDHDDPKNHAVWILVREPTMSVLYDVGQLTIAGLPIRLQCVRRNCNSHLQLLRLRSRPCHLTPSLLHSAIIDFYSIITFPRPTTAISARNHIFAAADR